MGSTDGKQPRDRAQYFREYHQRNRDHKNQLKTERYRYRHHGITQSIYRRMAREQKHRCAVCGSKDFGRKGAQRFVIDHDHAHCPGDFGCSECVRQLLCHKCNMGLGHFRDSPELLEQAAEYVRAHRRNPDAG